jgi:hypothetical protein
MSFVAVNLPVELSLSSAFFDFVGAIASVEDGLQRAVRRSEAAFKTAEADLRDGEKKLRAALAALRAYVQAGGPCEAASMDSWIEQADEAVERIARDDTKVRKVLFRIEKLMRRGPPDYARFIAPFRRRYEAIADQYLAAYSDAAFELRVARAEAFKDAEPAGPTFSDPKELRRYLKSLN